MTQKKILYSITRLSELLKIEDTIGKCKETEVKYTDNVLGNYDSTKIRNYNTCISCATYVITARYQAKLQGL